MNNADGKHVPLTQRVQTIADYLEKIHWSNPDEHEVNTSKILEDNNALEACFKLMTELCTAIKGAKFNKQPGPDGVTMELVKWLDHDNRRTLLNLINTWWESKNAPSALFLARVVPIFKKGDANIAANYRPISLLNNFYKLYMVLIGARRRDGTGTFKDSKMVSGLKNQLRMLFENQRGITRFGKKLLTKYNMTNLLLLYTDWVSAARYTDVIADCYSKPIAYIRFFF